VPRIRSIHPGLFTDEAFVSVSDAAQIFYIGLLTEADDQGVFEWKPITLKMRLRPASLSPVDSLLTELQDAQRIVSYEIAGRHYGAIRNFRKFQRPKYPNALHPITDEIRSYVGLSPTIPEISEAQPPPIPPNAEKSPQMEEVGGRRKERKSSEPNGSGGKPPDDPVKDMFDRGVAILGEKGRSLIGQARQKHKDLAVLEAIGRCEEVRPSDPAAFFIKALAAVERKGANGGGFTVGVG
jgi:hypothetical protein